MKRAQTLSMDLMVGIMIFVGMLIVFFGIMMFVAKPPDVSDLNSEGEHIVKTLDSVEMGVIKENQIDDKELQELVSKDYDELKNELGIRNEFCIFLEDEEGNVIPIETKDGRLVAGVGDSNVEIGVGVGGQQMLCGK